MAEVIPLVPRRRETRSAPVELTDEERRALLDPDAIDRYSQLPPIDQLELLQRQIRASNESVGLAGAGQAVAVLIGSFKVGNVFESREHRQAFALAMVQQLAEFPGWVLDAAIRRAPREFAWLPAISEMIALCNQQWEPQRRRAPAIRAMEAEHQRRQQEAAEQQRRRDDDARYVGEIQDRAISVYGAAALLPGDIECAGQLRRVLRRGGRFFTWRECLSSGEPWAAKLCRQLALIARLIRARRDGRCDPENSASIADLVISDEGAARLRIEQAEALAPIPAAVGGKEEYSDLEAVMAEIEVEAGLDGSVVRTPRPSESSEVAKARAADREKELLRQKLFRYAESRLPDQQREAAIFGLMSDDAKVAQEWFDQLRDQMCAERWDDRLDPEEARSFSDHLRELPIFNNGPRTSSDPG
jgi:hypothetical protein